MPNGGRGHLRRAVIERDRQCVAYLLDKLHQCRDAYGNPHHPADANRLTLEHVKLDGRRLDDPLHCMAMCSQGNVVEHWSSANNEIANAFLTGVRIGQGG
jgi:hypothetical protein